MVSAMVCTGVLAFILITALAMVVVSSRDRGLFIPFINERQDARVKRSGKRCVGDGPFAQSGSSCTEIAAKTPRGLETTSCKKLPRLSVESKHDEQARCR
ncbi:hypothetical protein F5148DRAFT_861478 [Russula earlei]|uniref:Uncharacterized protein n=1 Tax=Russula earlei TaxID=71964 RepID=A0ACC0UC98_9AGAM|nr:hypothetical protein F5148DRAFT_861478 [Russula earlei]